MPTSPTTRKRPSAASYISETVFDYDRHKARLTEIDEEMSAPGFWDDSDAAQKTVAELSRLKERTSTVESLVRLQGDIEVLMEFAEEDPASEADLRAQLEATESELVGVERQAKLSGDDDSRPAFVTIQAGEGGTDAADFADMLLRMYARWAETNGYKAELVDQSPGEEAGIRNATLRLAGDHPFGHLKGETGNHRLVRISPFDSAGRRHTAFAAVDVTPDFGDDEPIEIDWGKDVREDTYRASGAGGQHVNKTDSAIRLTHEPTGEIVQCQNDRSQHKNRAEARKMLLARLYQREQEAKDAEASARRGEKSKIGFGGVTIRHYVLQPEQYVKDTRSGMKTGNPMSVLDGELQPYLDDHLEWLMSGEGATGDDE